MVKKLLIIFSLCVFYVNAAFAERLKIGMVTDVGGVNDQSFNQSAWEGLNKVKKDLNLRVNYLESKQDADYVVNLQSMLEGKNDLIWGIGFKMSEAIKRAAKENPKQKFAIIDYSFEKENLPNVVGVMFKAEEGAFLAGYIAAKMSKSGILGFVGGMDVPIIHAFQFGFKAGAYSANKKIKILEQFAESFSDAAKGKAIANQMMGKGADVLFHAAGAVGDGVIEAAKEKNKFAVGVDRDQHYLAPKNVITSSLKSVDKAIYRVSSELNAGHFKGGSTLYLGLKEDAVDIASSTKELVPDSILKEVQEWKKDIIKGKFSPPKDKASYLKFIK